MREQENHNKLFQILNNESFSSKFISGIAGDRILNKEEKILFDRLLDESGSDFYVKILFFITHEIFEKEHAVLLWNEILNHKEKLSEILNRNIEITVATLDYLTNIKNELSNPKIIGEAFIGKIAEISSVDPLTKLYTRQHLGQAIDVELIRYSRYKVKFSILLIDIDHFKSVNDTDGHQAGDELLIAISKVFISDLRDLDICARYGGDEFLFILPHTSSTEAFEIAERIRKKVETTFRKKYGITLSIGISSCPDNAVSIGDLIKKADDAAYKSKKAGGNKTIRGEF